jgi:hypothetical protein
MIPDSYIETEPDSPDFGKLIVVDLRPERLLPNSSMNLNDPGELIDYPVSDVWLDHYNRLGLTRREPVTIPEKVDSLSKELTLLNNVISGGGWGINNNVNYITRGASLQKPPEPRQIQRKPPDTKREGVY